MSFPHGQEHLVCLKCLPKSHRFRMSLFQNVEFLVFILVMTMEGSGTARSEGTGTGPDYLVNRDYQKNEGPFGKKIARKSRNSCRLNGSVQKESVQDNVIWGTLNVL